MSVSNGFFMVLGVMAFTYLVVYRKNHFFGNLMFLVMGIGVLYTGTDLLTKAMGWIIIGSGFISLVYDIISNMKFAKTGQYNKI